MSTKDKVPSFFSTSLQPVWDLWSDFKSLNILCYKLNQHVEDKEWGNEWDTTNWKPSRFCLILKRFPSYRRVQLIHIQALKESIFSQLLSCSGWAAQRSVNTSFVPKTWTYLNFLMQTGWEFTFFSYWPSFYLFLSSMTLIANSSME